MRGSAVDLGVAAAAAGMADGNAVVFEADMLPQREVLHDAECVEPWDLPAVDDLEVAAAAAAAAMEVLQPKSSSEDDTSRGGSSSGSGSEEESSEDAYVAEAGTVIQPLKLVLQVNEGSNSLILQIQHSNTEFTGDVLPKATPVLPQPATEVLSPSPSSSSSSSSSSSDSSDSDVESVDATGLRELITKACADADDDDLDGGIAGKAPGDELGLPAVVPLDVEIMADDMIEVAGTIMSKFEGMIVVQGHQNARALTEGSVLCLDDRSPLGRVEEVFGPVLQPLYAFRYAGSGAAMPEGVRPGAAVFNVVRLSTFLMQEQLYDRRARAAETSVACASDGEVEGGEDDAPYFSDDEKEAEYQRQLKAQNIKRKAADGEGLGHGSGASVDGRQARRPRQLGSRPSTQFQAAATASHMCVALALSDGGAGGGRGGRGRGRGAGGRNAAPPSARGAGRSAGRGAPPGVPQQQQHAGVVPQPGLPLQAGYMTAQYSRSTSTAASGQPAPPSQPPAPQGHRLAAQPGPGPHANCYAPHPQMEQPQMFLPYAQQGPPPLYSPQHTGMPAQHGYGAAYPGYGGVPLPYGGPPPSTAPWPPQGYMYGAAPAPYANGAPHFRPPPTGYGRPNCQGY